MVACTYPAHAFNEIGQLETFLVGGGIDLRIDGERMAQSIGRFRAEIENSADSSVDLQTIPKVPDDVAAIAVDTPAEHLRWLKNVDSIGLVKNHLEGLQSAEVFIVLGCWM